MGTGTSRGKRVAPACVSEIRATKPGSSVSSPKHPVGLFKPLKIHTILRNSRAQPDCHSEGHDSDFSGEDEDVDGELDTVLADYEETRAETAPGKKTPPKKTFMRSKTYGLCHFSREDPEEEVSSAPGLTEDEPRVSVRGRRDVNKRNNPAFTHQKTHTSASPTQHHPPSPGFLTRGPLLGAVPTSEKQSTFGSCHSSSLTTPVMLYDGSEEELMDTIEREFS